MARQSVIYNFKTVTLNLGMKDLLSYTSTTYWTFRYLISSFPSGLRALSSILRKVKLLLKKNSTVRFMNFT